MVSCKGIVQVLSSRYIALPSRARVSKLTHLSRLSSGIVAAAGLSEVPSSTSDVACLSFTAVKSSADEQKPPHPGPRRQTTSEGCHATSTNNEQQL